MKRVIKYFTLIFVCVLLLLTSSCSCKRCNKDNDEVKIESISVVSSTIPQTFFTTEVDDKIDDIQINVNKSDKNVETINVNKDMISSEDYALLATPGTHTITITYQGFTTTVTLIVEKQDEEVPPVKEEITYSIRVKDIAGKPLSGFYVEVYLDDEIVDEGYTGNDGMFVTEQLPEKYEFLLETRDGYYLNQELYETDLLGTLIEVEAGLEPFKGVEAPSGHVYELGDLMYDFTVTDTNGNELTLYDLLDNYKAVVLNFWYTTCSYCIQEFPYMTEAYESTYTNAAGETVKYSDEIAVIAINPGIAGTGDTLDAIKDFQRQMGLSFNVCLDNDANDEDITFEPELTKMFGIYEYPTTYIIDRYGLIAYHEGGAILATEKWTQTFDVFLAEDYYPTYVGEGGTDITIEKPDITQEDSSVLEAVANGTNVDGTKFNGTYAPEDNKDAEYSWPWIVGEYNGKDCIMPSNKFKNNSFSIVYVTVDMKEGDVFTFDYFASTEQYDILYVVVDGNIASEIRGVSPDWETSYSYVALEDGKYEIGLCYLKDGSYSVGDDCIYLSNLRILRTDNIDQETYIFRECATGLINEFTMSYPSYVDVVYNEHDGYYHVGTENGPYLFADMRSGTKWNNTTLYDIALEGKCIGADGVDYNDIIKEYTIYASNSTLGYTPITEELANALRQITKALGDPVAASNPNQWLEVCVYYSAYGTNGVELGIPTTGVCPWEPIMLEGDAIEEPVVAEGTFDRIILPRGFMFGFIPTVSGVYKFSTIEENIETLCWFCDEDGTAIAEGDYGLREYAKLASVDNITNINSVSHRYLEEGKLYLFRAGFYDVALYDTINVQIEYIAEEFDMLTVASPGYHTSSDEEMGDIISGNYVDVELDETGFYKVVGSAAHDTYVYCDWIYINNITTGKSLQDCMDPKYDAFNFNKDEYGYPIFDEEGYYRYTGLDDEQQLTRFYVCIDADENEFYIKEVGEGEYTEENGYTYLKFTPEQIEEIGLVDYTAYVNEYVNANMITDETSELYGCVKVDEKFAKVLAELMGKYTFAVKDNWLKLCYYYKHIGA